MKFFLAILLLLSFTANAGQIAKGEVSEVVNLIGSGEVFGVRLSKDSSGVCAGEWIVFRQSNFNGNIESYRFAFSMATTALVSGKQVRIHNYKNDACDGPTFIGLYK